MHAALQVQCKVLVFTVFFLFYFILQFTSHRFSIAWSRVLPTGGVDNINEKGVQFYKDYIDKVISNNMEPMVSLSLFSAYLFDLLFNY